MNWFWTIIELSATLFETMILFSFINTFLHRSFSYRLVYIALPIIHTIFVSLLNMNALDQMSTALLTIAFSCILVFVFFKGRIFIRLGLTIAFYTTWMASEFGVLIILNSFVKDFIINLQKPSIERITAIVMSKLVIFLILKFIQHFSIKNDYKLSIKKTLPLYILPLITILIIISMQLFWASQPSSSRFMLAGISLVALLFANFIVFDQYKRSIHEVEALSQINQIKQQQASQIEMIGMVEKQNQEVRKIAHDLKNSLLPSILYLQQGKQEQSLKSLEQIVETLNDLQRSPAITGHIMIDMILVYKTAKAKARDININVDSQLNDPIFMPDTDISVILGNTLDNAIEAVEKISDIHMRAIDIQLRSGHGLFSITISNPVDQDIIIQNGRLKGLKTDSRNHGIGLDSIKELASRNHGFVDLQCKNQTFTLMLSFENLPLNA